MTVALAISLLFTALAVAGFGLLVAPLNALRTQVLADALPADQHAEAFSLLYAAMGIGFALSSVAAALLLSLVGARGSLLLAAVITAVTGLIALAADGRGAPLLRGR